MKRLYPEKLKTIRVVLALILVVPISAIFLDAWRLVPPRAIVIIASLQIIPSILKAIVSPGWMAIGLFVVLGLTLAFGRVYCSTVCPLGILQDVIIRLRRKIDRRKRFQYRKQYIVLHYALLGATALAAIAGSMTLLNLLEPYSNYGRIMTNGVEPLLILGNNAISFLLGKFGVYSLYRITLRAIPWETLGVSALFLGVVGHMAYRHGRLFCNTLCPAGALLGILSRLSFFKLVVDDDACNGCGACERVCKAGCIESATMTIDFHACVGCFNCLKSCPTDGIVFRSVLAERKMAEKSASVNHARRDFVRGIGPSILVLLGTGAADGEAPIPMTCGYSDSKQFPVSPPGSQSVSRFSRLCTACHLCVTACPSQVLAPSFLEYGVAGVFQPKMNYSAGFCNYDCIVCGQVCPSGAILEVNSVRKKEIQIGRAAFVREDCIVFSKKQDCAACSEHCPTKAVYTVPFGDHLRLPELNNDICVGCGACEHACPTEPRKAIYVVANPVHRKAKKPETKKQDAKLFDSKEDFPF